MIEGNENNFKELVKEGTVLVKFHAVWCGPCKMLNPVVEEVAKEKNLKVVTIDIDESENLAMKYGVMSVPTLMLFKDGKLEATKVGYIPKEALVEWMGAN